MQPAPPPVSADNCYGFAKVSVFERLPAILEEAIKSGGVERKTVQPMFDDIKANAKLSKIQTGPEIEIFNEQIKEDSNWGNTPWFFLER